MAVWSGKQLSAEDILGMKPEDLKTKLESAATKADLEEFKAKQTEQTNSLTAIQAALAKLTTPPPPDPDPNIKADVDDPTTQILTDPAGYINRQTAEVANTALQARADVLEMRARSAYSGAFAKYGQELTESAARFSLAQRAQDGFWDYHVRTFTGDKFLKGDLQQGSYPSMIGSSSFAPSNGVSDNDPNKGFIPDQVEFFKDHKVPLDKAAALKKMLDGGEPISLDTYKRMVGHA